MGLSIPQPSANADAYVSKFSDLQAIYNSRTTAKNEIDIISADWQAYEYFASNSSAFAELTELLISNLDSSILFIWSGLGALARTWNDHAVVCFWHAYNLDKDRCSYWYLILAYTTVDQAKARELLINKDNLPLCIDSSQLSLKLNQDNTNSVNYSLYLGELTHPALLRKYNFVSQGHSGMGRLVSLMFELKILLIGHTPSSYWLEKNNKFHFKINENRYIFEYIEGMTEENNKVGYDFDLDLGVGFHHILSKAITCGKWLRLIRDPRDLLISNYDYYKFAFGKDSTWSYEDVLDLPISDGLFGLCPAGEFALQHILIEPMLKDGRALLLCFEDLEPSNRGLELIKQVLSYMQVERNEQQILTALHNAHNDRRLERWKENNERVYQQCGKSLKWKKRKIDCFDRRVELLVKCLNVKLPYEETNSYQAKQITSWHAEALAVATDLWVNKTLSKISKLNWPTQDLQSLHQPLTKICSLVEELPLLEFQLVETLLDHETYRGFALDKLKKLSQMPGHRIIRLLVALVALKFMPGNQIFINEVKAILYADYVSEVERNEIISRLSVLGYQDKIREISNQ